MLVLALTLQGHTQTHTSSAAGSDWKWHLGFVSLRVSDKNTDYAEGLPEGGRENGGTRQKRGGREVCCVYCC